VSTTNDIVNILLGARAPVTVDRIAAVLSVGPRVVSGLLHALHQAARVSRAPVHQKKFEYWLSADQHAAEMAKRDEKPAAPSHEAAGVAIITDVVRLPGRLMYLERLQRREAFAHDATFAAIVDDYRKTLAAVRTQQRREDAQEGAPA
jgi:hypothetical protein